MNEIVLDTKNGTLRDQLKKLSTIELSKEYDKDFEEKYKNQFVKYKDLPMDYRHEWIMKHVPSCSTVLDVGSGSGLLVHHLRCKGFAADGCDISKEAVSSASKNVPDAVFKQGPVEKLPFEDNSYDVVCSSQMIEHLKSPAEGIKEMYRVAKQKVLLTTPIEKNLFDKTHLHFFTFYDMMRIVEEAVGHENYTIARINKFNRFAKANCFAVEIWKGERNDY